VHSSTAHFSSEAAALTMLLEELYGPSITHSVGGYMTDFRFVPIHISGTKETVVSEQC
jgi:hypothetical protein